MWIYVILGYGFAEAALPVLGIADGEEDALWMCGCSAAMIERKLPGEVVKGAPQVVNDIPDAEAYLSLEIGIVRHANDGEDV
jgi:hypothetical protein